MSIKKINQFPDGNGNLTNDDLFIFMDDPSGSGVTKKISLSQLGSAIGGGGGGGVDTGDITFSGVQIIGAGEGSGDGNGYGTIELVPDSGRYTQNQYIIIDPTAPDHIHIRAGGDQDNSSAELIFGGEQAHVRVVDFGHQVIVRSYGIDSNITILCLSVQSSPDQTLIVGDSSLPVGSYVIISEVKHEVISCEEDQDNPGEFIIYLTGDASIASNSEVTFTVDGPKNWTFGNDGALDLANGGLRFDDNTTQSTAGVVSTDPSVASFIKVNNIVTLSQADYDNLTPDSNTVYLIVEVP